MRGDGYTDSVLLLHLLQQALMLFRFDILCGHHLGFQIKIAVKTEQKILILWRYLLPFHDTSRDSEGPCKGAIGFFLFLFLSFLFCFSDKWNLTERGVLSDGKIDRKTKTVC